MTIKTENIVSQSRVNRDFGYVSRMAETYNYALILRYNSPAYILIKYDMLGEALKDMGFEIRVRHELN